MGEIAGNVIVIPPDDGSEPGYEIAFQIYDEAQNSGFFANYSYLINISGNLQIGDVFLFSLPFATYQHHWLKLFDGSVWISVNFPQWDEPETGLVTVPLTVTTITENTTIFELGFQLIPSSIILSSFKAEYSGGTFEILSKSKSTPILVMGGTWKCAVGSIKAVEDTCGIWPVGFLLNIMLPVCSWFFLCGKPLND